MLQSVPPPPLWLEMLKLTVGPVIAAIVVIVGLLWRDRIERRNAAQAWYDKTYIEEGIDVFIAHLSALQYDCIVPRRLFLNKVSLDLLPPHVAGRLSVVVPGTEFFFACHALEAILISVSDNDQMIESPLEFDELYSFAGHLLAFAENIRKALIQVRIRDKRQVYDVRLKRSLLKVVAQGQLSFQNGETLEIVHRRFIEKYAERGGDAMLAKMSAAQKALWRKTLLKAMKPS